jgi:RimJ/RimL family protein N-acetyltransferase
MIAGMDEIEIRVDDLLLRPWRPADAAEVTRACQDPEIQRWTGLPRPYLPEHAEHFVDTRTRLAWATGTAAPIGVFDAGTGELLGSNGLISLNQDADGGAGEIGYWTAPWARNRGVATRATHAVARWCLETLGLSRLTWRAEVGNFASRLVAERVGFAVEGLLRNSGRRGPGGELVDCWGAALIPGQLRDPSIPLPRQLQLRAATFGAPRPRLHASTSQGEQISLRPMRGDDLDAIVAACRDPDSVRWTTVPSPYHRADAEFFVTTYAPRRWLCGDGAIFAVAGPDDAYAGSMDLRLVGREPGELTGGVGDVGYLIAPWARGRGYASAALARLCRWGFEALELRRIEWRAYQGNDASRAVAQRAGFTIEGLARAGCVQRGEYRDAWIGAILATDRPAGEPPAIATPAPLTPPGAGGTGSVARGHD